ncbi:MAG: AsmA-like C-terminal region-containing protein [Candidatus Gastranaerophilales bacterium]|nr:AsmA-like C-terminal region-containing protein [Candidatus Gastranaerophilales bacterium]
MFKFLKNTCIVFLSLIVIAYLAIVLILPIAVNTFYDKDKTVKAFVKQNTGLDLNYDSLKVITTPLMSIGVKADNLVLSMPEDKKVFNFDNLTFRISLPSLLFKTIKVTCADIKNPTVNLDLNKTSTQYEIADYLTEYFANTNQEKEEEKAEEEAAETPQFNLSDIKIKINKLNIDNYNILINDVKNKHKLSLHGGNLTLKFDGKHLKITSNPILKYDDNENITANIDVKTYVPEFTLPEENTTSQTNNADFINPVEMFGKYNLKSKIQTKLSITEGQASPKINGNLYVTDTTMNIGGGLALPYSYLKLDFGGYNVNIDSNLCLAEKETANIAGDMHFGKDFDTNIAVKTDKINLSSILRLAKAILDTANIQNNLDTISANGILQSDMKVKTDLKTIKSSGKITLSNGSVRDSATGLSLSNMRANVLLDNNNIKIDDTEVYVNGTPFIAQGTINEKSEADIKIYTKNLPLAKLYASFAPADLKKNYLVKNGILSLDILINGKLDKIEPKIKTEIVNLIVKDIADGLDIVNGNCSVDLDTDLKTYNGKITNKNLVVTSDAMGLTIRNIQTNVDFNDRDIIIKPTDFIINGVSNLNISGEIKNYIQKPEFAVIGNGSMRAIDIKNLAGKDLALYIKSQGVIPVKLLIKGDDKKQSILFRAYGSPNEYVTPIDIAEITGKNSTIQLLAEIANNKVTFKQTGLFSGSYTDVNSEITSNPVVSVTGGIKLDKNLTLNNIKIQTNGNKKIGIYAFEKSSMNANADITVTGTANKPVIKGVVKGENMNIPQLKTKLDNGDITLKGDVFDFDLKKLNLNGTSLDLNGRGLLDFAPILTITDVKLKSDNLDADKAAQVTEYMAKVPALNPPSNGAPADMPIKVNTGSIEIQKLKSGDIIAENIVSDLKLIKNVVYLNNLKANAFDGLFNGDVTMNLINSYITAVVSGAGMNADKTVTACAAMKNTIFGTLGFSADITLKGVTYEEQMRTLNGKADFNITKGQFGSLGKFETFLKADNLASIAFISTKIGSVMNKVSPHNTAEFDKLNGNVTFKNGLMAISPITSSGKNMSMYITGNLNLTNNNADMLILGKVSEEVASLLGPLEQLNPTRLLKKSNTSWAAITLGVLNAINEKSTPAEINKIPQLTPAPSTDNTSKFVVKIKGNIEKPQSAVKSFKWLSPESDLTEAQSMLSPKEVVENVVKSIPTTKEEAINTLKEAGKNTLLNLGKQLLAPAETQTQTQTQTQTATTKTETETKTEE